MWRKEQHQEELEENTTICSCFNTKNTISYKSLLKTTLQSESTKRSDNNFEFMARLLKFQLLSVIVMRLDFKIKIGFFFLKQLNPFEATLHISHTRTDARTPEEGNVTSQAGCTLQKVSAGEWRNNATLPRSIVSRLKRAEQSRHLFGLNNAAFRELKFRGGQLRILWHHQCVDKITAKQLRGGGWGGINTYHLWKLVSGLCNSFSVVAVHHKDEALEEEKKRNEKMYRRMNE